MDRKTMDAFVRDFLIALRPVQESPTPRDLLRRVRDVCDGFQERGRGNIRLSTIPLAFWVQLMSDFVDAYMEAEDDADLLLRLREALGSRIQASARAHDIDLEVLNA